ncbi:MAG: ABC transporter permease [Candidatus Omnitrophica bacterium]|nr:ABC transporter permease [Candidatus Omnitrophota bacterium]
MLNWLKKIGKSFSIFFYFFGGLGVLFLLCLRYCFTRPFEFKRTLNFAKRSGSDSLPIVSLISFFLGLIFGLQIAYLMQRLGSEMYIASIVALSMVRELGPVITALVVAGRVGAAITAEIGTMQVTEQIDALKTLAYSPIKYLALPRLIALSLMLPLLTVYANLLGILGGYIICVYRLGITSRMYLNITFDAIMFKDLFSGLLKTIFFGMIIAITSCYHGFKAKGGAEGVGRATTNTVVTSFILIIVADCLFTALFYFAFP